MDEHPYDVHMSELLGSDHPRRFACGSLSSSDESTESSDEYSEEG